ncbi:MAG TPA: hypothetical protein VN677_03585, partial [Gemmatimonadaceae bacterium]|nr:hypothetical protein [Gemmatimonadaceae bacterium]
MAIPPLRTALLASAFAIAPATSLAQTATTGSLSPTEQAVVRSVDAHNADALALLIRLVNINSGTTNFAGVR